MGELARLKGLGPKTEQQLFDIGITCKSELADVGAVQAYLRLKKQAAPNTSLNFLYALVGALENRHWMDVAKTDKARLLFELEDNALHAEIFKEEGRISSD